MSLTTLLRRRARTETAENANGPGWFAAEPAAPVDETYGCAPIEDARWRQPVRVVGRVRSVRAQPRANVPTLECTLVDHSGGIGVVFLGRRNVPGIQLGTRMIVEGMAGHTMGSLPCSTLGTRCSGKVSGASIRRSTGWRR